MLYNVITLPTDDLEACKQNSISVLKKSTLKFYNATFMSPDFSLSFCIEYGMSPLKKAIHSHINKTVLQY